MMNWPPLVPTSVDEFVFVIFVVFILEKRYPNVLLGLLYGVVPFHVVTLKSHSTVEQVVHGAEPPYSLWC